MFHVPEQYREKKHPLLKSDSSYGNNGFFVIPHHRISDYFYNVQASDGMGWEHCSITISAKDKKRKVERCPTWEEMCYIKSLFWDDETPVMQLHPPKSDWINNHPYCLHLWVPTEQQIPLPKSVFVGHKLLNA